MMRSMATSRCFVRVCGIVILVLGAGLLYRLCLYSELHATVILENDGGFTAIAVLDETAGQLVVAREGEPFGIVDIRTSAGIASLDLAGFPDDHTAYAIGGKCLIYYDHLPIRRAVLMDTKLHPTAQADATGPVSLSQSGEWLFAKVAGVLRRFRVSSGTFEDGGIVRNTPAYESMATSTDGAILAFAALDNTVRVGAFRNGTFESPKFVPWPGRIPPQRLVFDEHAKALIMAGGSDWAVADLATNKLSCCGRDEYAVVYAGFLKCGRHVVIVCNSGVFRFFDHWNGNEVLRWQLNWSIIPRRVDRGVYMASMNTLAVTLHPRGIALVDVEPVCMGCLPASPTR